MSVHPPEPLYYHRLPPAPHFVGREPELARLRTFWERNARGVLALVGLGGAGKTALAARFLQELAQGRLPQSEGLFVWSFYQEPDPAQFLRQAHAYFVPTTRLYSGAKGAGLLHLLDDALSQPKRYLLVLDGLERVQRQEADRPTRHGEIEDPLLRALLVRLGSGLRKTTAIITSRFPLRDLHRCREAGYRHLVAYRHLDVGALEPAAARGLLRARGVKGPDADLDALINDYGAHALTLDHLGGLVGQFLDGDPKRAPDASAFARPAGDRQALRLARLLRHYEQYLSPVELALLTRLSLVRRNITAEQAAELFLCSPAIRPKTAHRAREVLERFPRFESIFFKRGIADLSAAVEQATEEALCAAPIAGPEAIFFRELSSAADEAIEQIDSFDPSMLAEVAHAYQGHLGEASSELRPLSSADRRDLAFYYLRYAQLREHPLLPFTEPGAHKTLVWKKTKTSEHTQHKIWAAAHPLSDDISPADVLTCFRQARGWLEYLVIKHHLLRRVRKTCRLLQEKWARAGPLAPLDRSSLQQTLDLLHARHLLIQEGDGSYSVHPALRDHFGQLADASERSRWHDLIREGLISLARRPGRRPPEDFRTLDLVEEAIHHALQAKQAEDAWSLYANVMGGLRHLGWKLGEVDRGLRILRYFHPCPDRWAMGWYLRCLGELEEAYSHNGLSHFRADIRLLQGRLPEAAAESDDGRTTTARFLMGETIALPSGALGCAIPRAQLLLYLGRLQSAWKSAAMSELYGEMGWEGDRARCELFIAEAARRQNDLTGCENHIGNAARWILHSGSVEHLCLMHLVRGRWNRAVERPTEAASDLDEGLHVAEQCGLGLYMIELLCERGCLEMSRGELMRAETLLRQAVERAMGPSCRFLWGAAQAGHLLGQVLLREGNKAEARGVLEAALTVRLAIQDPHTQETQTLLARLA
jgi:hypothetical protein